MGADEPVVVTQEDVQLTRSLCEFIQQCPSPFHSVDAVRKRLDGAGFRYLAEKDAWDLVPGEGYYTIRNGSSIVAFRMQEEASHPQFSVVASHSDSPNFRVKANPVLTGPGPYVRLNVDGYGGVIERTWLDRPLSLAGRVLVDECGCVQSHLFAPDEDLVIIPSVAIHQDRNVNKEGALNQQVDLCPLFSAAGEAAYSFEGMIAERLNVEPERIVAHELGLVNRQAPAVWGWCNEFVSAPRLDDLQCVFASLNAFVNARNPNVTSVFACFDNEEVGSGTMQGALSTLLPDVLRRICACVDKGADAYARALARSFVVCCDNAHALHPNHPELFDEGNRAFINGGVVVKESSSQRYTTNAASRAFFLSLCMRAGVPTQEFANRSDAIGGSTLGHLLMRQVSVRSLDVGLAQLAMHSSYETAGTRDTGFLARALSEFYAATYELSPDGSFALG